MSATSTEKTERRNPADDIKDTMWFFLRFGGQKASTTDSIHHDEFIPDNEQCEFLEEYLREDWWDGLYNVGQTIDIS